MRSDTPPQERELKLVLPVRYAWKTVIQKLVDSGYTIGAPLNLRNDDLYLDTYDWQLMKNKVALRYRNENGKAFYTLKGIGQFDQGIAQRTELEIALERPLDNPLAVPEKRIKSAIMPLIFPRRLLELVRVCTHRKEYPLITPDGAKISLAFDSSGFGRERRPAVHCQRNYYEMEAELKEGDIMALGSLRQLLTVSFGYAFSSQSKLQRAIDSLHLAPLTRKASPELSVKLADSLEIALRKIIGSEFKWFQEQLPGVKDDLDPEFVHQARVTTRRMRSAVRVFQEAIPENTSKFLLDELKWLGGLFGAVRDIDVYGINLTKFEQVISHFPGAIRRELESGIDKQRRKPFQALSDALDSERYEKFAARVQKFVETPAAGAGAKPVRTGTIAQFAPEVINRDFAAVNEQGGKVLATPEMKQFHLLRIAMKRLRYATEFVAPAYGKALDPFIRRTVEIQDCLGELQDTVFTQNFSLQLMKDWQSKILDPDVPFVLGEICQYQAEIAKERKASFAGIWERFACAETSQFLVGVFTARKAAEQLARG